MRLLYIVHGYPPRARAGTEVYTQQLAGAMAARGHAVTVLTRDARARRLEVTRDDGVEVVWLPGVGNAAGGRGRNGSTEPPPAAGAAPWDHQCRRAVEELVVRGAPQIVHVQHLMGHPVDLLPFFRDRGAAVVATLPDYWYLCPFGQMHRPADGRNCARVELPTCARCYVPATWKPVLAWLAGYGREVRRVLAEQVSSGSPLRRLEKCFGVAKHATRNLTESLAARRHGALETVTRRRTRMHGLLSGVDLLLAPSAFVRDRYVAEGLDPARIRVCDYGLAWPAPQPVRWRPGAPLRFAFFGSIHRTKGLHVLLAAFVRLRGAAAQLHVFGAPTDERSRYWQRLRRQARQPGVVLHGGFASRDLPRLFAQIDVVVVPSLWAENSPLVIHEAVAAGRPVFASRIGGIPELVPHHQTETLFPAGQVAALTRVLQRCADDPARALARTQPVAGLKRLDEHADEMTAMYAPLVRAAGPEAERHV